MRTTCLVNNYNYRRFIGEAIDSALRQTLAFDEIIVVDDGSTDDSLQFLKRRYGGNRRVQIVAKENEGQLSCFNEGFARSSGDIIFFLDADDVFDDEYVQRAMRVYERSPTHDCVIASYRLFGNMQDDTGQATRDMDLGYSAVAAWCLKSWLGNPTSCLSFRRTLLERILPLPNQSDWRIQADVCLVFGSSLVGGRKFQLAAPLVNYRVHDDNQFLGKDLENAAIYRHRLARNRLFGHFQSQLTMDIDRLPEFAHWEFSTADLLTSKRLKHYLRIVLASKLPWRHRIKSVGWMLGHYWFGFRRDTEVDTEAADLQFNVSPQQPAAESDQPEIIPMKKAA